VYPCPCLHRKQQCGLLSIVLSHPRLVLFFGSEVQAIDGITRPSDGSLMCFAISSDLLAVFRACRSSLSQAKIQLLSLSMINPYREWESVLHLEESLHIKCHTSRRTSTSVCQALNRVNMLAVPQQSQSP
jgi:hypothetical protein